MEDRPALTEIEITPEMIEAGIDALFESQVIYEVGSVDFASAVAGIFRAMLTASPARSHPASSD